MKKLLCFSLILFVLLTAAGIFLASRKQLWNDEIYTQLNLEKTSLAGIVHGDLIEGNLCPLFYLVQKTFLETCHYRLPFSWQHEFYYHEPASQILMRIPAIIYMSLALVLIFFTFARSYSCQIGFFALAFALSSPTVWMNWAEARPYGLWFLLTVLQAYLLLALLRDPKKGSWVNLSICHLLLILTSVLSLPQILLVTAAACICIKKDRMKLITTGLLCSALGYFYANQVQKIYGFAPTNSMGFIGQALKHVGDCLLTLQDMTFMPLGIPMDLPWAWLIPLSICLVYLAIKVTDLPTGRQAPFSIFKESALFLSMTIGLLLATFGILFMFSVWKITGAADYFQVPGRYLVFLAPFGLFTITLSYVNFIQTAKSPLMRNSIHALYAGTLLAAYVTTFKFISSVGFYN